MHLNFLLFLHRLAEEARINAFESKSKIIKPEHTIAAAKVIKHFQYFSFLFNVKCIMTAYTKVFSVSVDMFLFIIQNLWKCNVL